MAIFRATPPTGPANLYTTDSVIRGVSLKDILRIAKLEIGEEYLGSDDWVWERIA